MEREANWSHHANLLGRDRASGSINGEEVNNNKENRSVKSDDWAKK